MTTSNNPLAVLSLVAAKAILKNVPRAILLNDEGIIYDGKTLDILGYVSPEISIAGKKIKIVEHKLTSDSDAVYLQYHRNSKKYLQPRIEKIVRKLAARKSASVATGISEVRSAA